MGTGGTAKCVQGYSSGSTTLGKWRKASMNSATRALTLEFFDGASCTGTKHAAVVANTATRTAQQYPATLDINRGSSVQSAECMVDPDDQYSSLSVEFTSSWTPFNSAAMALFSQAGAQNGGSAGCTDSLVIGAQEKECNSCFVSGTNAFSKATCSSAGISITAGYTDSACSSGVAGTPTLTYVKDKCYSGEANSFVPAVSGLAWELLDCGATAWGSSDVCGSPYVWDLCDADCVAAAQKLITTIVIVVIIGVVCCCCVIVGTIIGIIVCCVTGAACCVAGASKKQQAENGVAMQDHSVQQVQVGQVVAAQPVQQATVVAATVVAA